MWKYVSRRIRDTFERSANHFDKRGTTGVVNAPGNINEEKNKRPCTPCCWFNSQKCWNSTQQGNNTNNNQKWNFEHLTASWFGAITWSSALVIGWYTSQLIHLKYKYHLNQRSECSHSSLLSSVYPYIRSVDKNQIYLNSVSKIEKIVNNFAPIVYSVSNDESGAHKQSTSSASTSSANPDSSEDLLGDVLNSIENKLGLAAIENGQLQDGLNLLRSAANRNHAPALYNLGLCYEMGMGVAVDEKSAMELYRVAAALEHPGALYNLGIYYGQGRGGLTRDIETATRLLRLAAVQGQQDAKNALKTLDVNTVEPARNKDEGLYALNRLDVNTVEPPPNNNEGLWSYMFSPQYSHSNSVVPTPTTLFVENVNYHQTQNTGATVY